jgi:membrane-associated phospholipid phosphatase
MSENPEKNNKSVSAGSGIIKSLTAVLRSGYFYLGLLSLFAGMELNFISQTYLNNYIQKGNTLPALNDIILDRLPFYNVSIFYDIFSFIPVLIIIIYVIHKKDYNRVPFFLLMCGLIEIIRGIFIVITPLGNPPLFTGTDGLFNGFSKFEQGVYPSGHVGNVFMMFLMVNSRFYKWLLFFCLIVVIISLYYAHAHYSIDILSGFLFAYAVYSFGSRHLKMFELNS